MIRFFPQKEGNFVLTSELMCKRVWNAICLINLSLKL